MRRRRLSIRVVVALAAVSLLACGGDTKSPTTPPNPPQKFGLLTLVGNGVSGSPVIGVDSFAATTSVPYSFVATTGFTNLQVLLDGAIVPASGSVRMDRNHTLLVGADAVVAAVSPDPMQVQEIRALATSATPRISFQGILDRAVRLSDQVGADSVARLYSGLDHAFDPVADSSVIRRSNQALGGQMFSIGDSTEAQAHTASTVAVAAGSRPITVVYINGIVNSPADALGTAVHLRGVMSAAGMTTSSTLSVKYFYNATWYHRADEVSKCMMAQASLAGDRNWTDWVDLALKCTSLADLNRAKDQLLALLNDDPNTANGDARLLAEAVRAEHRAGRAVILVGHSQGTLIAQQAIKILTQGQTDALSAPASCLGSINIAAPLTYIGGQVARRDGVAAEGVESKDIILRLGLNQDERITTYFSDYYDAFLPSLLDPKSSWNPIKIGSNLTLAAAYPVVDLFADIQLHLIRKNYLGTYAGSRWVTTRLQAQITGVSSTCAATAPTGSVGVNTATSGPSQDPDGYTATVAGQSHSVGISSAVTFTNVAAGQQAVVLSGVASNCTVSGGTSKTVTVPAGGSVSASFNITCVATPVTIDLTVSALNAPATATIGGSAQVSATVANQGSANAGAFRVGFYFSTNATITTADEFSSNSICTVPGLTAGATYTCSTPIAVPSSLSPGTYYIGAIADDLGAVNESNESNNTRAAGPVALSGPPTVTPTAIASGLRNAHNIAIAGGVVYWVERNSDTGRLRSVSVNGGSITTLASELRQPSAIGVDETHVYWIERGGSTNSSALKRIPKAGGNIEVLASGLRNSQNRLALDGVAVYFGESVQGGGSNIVRVPKAGGPKTTIASGILNLETAVATDGISVYYSDGRHSVMRVPVLGGDPSIVADGEPEAIVIRGSTLYWVEYSDAIVRKVSVTGGAVTTLASGPGNGGGIATDGAWVYWITSQGVFRVPASGGAITSISSEGNTIGIGLDASNVYWATDPTIGDGQILKFPK